MLRTSAFSWYTLFRSYQWKTLRKMCFRFASFHQKWVSSAGSSLPHIVKTLKLTVWAFSLNFLHEFTLFVIDIHQNMPISLTLTPFDHFQNMSSGGIGPDLILTLCCMWLGGYKNFWNFILMLMLIPECCYPWPCILNLIAPSVRPSVTLLDFHSAQNVVWSHKCFSKMCMKTSMLNCSKMCVKA